MRITNELWNHLFNFSVKRCRNGLPVDNEVLRNHYLQQFRIRSDADYEVHQRVYAEVASRIKIWLSSFSPSELFELGG